MTKVLIRLEFDHLFPDEEKKEAIEYLKLISKYTLENVIGFFTTDPTPNFDSFFSNTDVQIDIINRVKRYCQSQKINEKPEIISTEGSLMIAELILSNRDILLLNNDLEVDKKRDEISLFKAFLVINKSLNKSTNLTLESTTENVEKIAEIMIALKFSSSDFGVYENIIVELIKLAYVSSYKFEQLINFLKTNENNDSLITDIYLYFNQKSIENLLKQVDHLIMQILLFRKNQSYKFVVEDSESKDFLNSLISEKSIVDTDFLNLRNFPLYKIGDDTFSIINPFFVLDKFTKSVKFLLQKCFNKKYNLKSTDRTFFNFYNKDFSENYLMKNLLNNIFNKKYFIKQEVLDSNDKEPDYYIRHGKDIYIFEYKDALIAKDIKSSGDIIKILDTLKGKFLTNPNDGKRIGIGQIINHIEAISNNNFKYDSKLNINQKYNIYPILLLSDRALEIPGINFIFDKWFNNNVKNIDDRLIIKNLIVMDIDTFILYQEFFKMKDKNFKTTLDEHLKRMKMNINGYGNNYYDFEKTIKNKITKKLSPISNRFSNDKFNPQLFINRFSHLVSEKSN